MSDFLALEEEEEPSSPFWMATFSDMMTLLLTFFVMLVAMSSVEVKKFEEALSYFTGKRGLMQEEGLMPGIMGVAGQPDEREQSRAFEDIARDIQEKGLGDGVEVDLMPQGIRVTFVDSIAFAPGSVALDEPAQRVLEIVAELASSVAAVEVEGHTDDTPISTVAYPSNWELSAARAAAVVRFLTVQPDSLPADRYIATGYGEFRPRESNDTPEGRARNRRITILFRTTEPESDSILPFDPVSP
ncbi:MAG: flagellar motor protein MotB [Bacteroidota bacterium]